MAKIINTKTKEVIFENEDSNCYGIVNEFLDKYSSTNYYTTIVVYERLSELIETMTGDSITPFNTVGKMIGYIPEILTATEETAIIHLMFGGDYFFVLPYDYEEDVNGWNKVLQTVFPEYSIID